VSTLIIVIIILVGLASVGLLFFLHHREEKRILEEGVRRVASEIKDDEKTFSIVNLMFKRGSLTTDEIISETGNELTAKVIIERLLDLEVWSGIWPIPLLRQRGSKFSIHPWWSDAIQILNDSGWDAEKVKIKAKCTIPFIKKTLWL
jgi:hypothetical protein